MLCLLREAMATCDWTGMDEAEAEVVGLWNRNWSWSWD